MQYRLDSKHIYILPWSANARVPEREREYHISRAPRRVVPSLSLYTLAWWIPVENSRLAIDDTLLPICALYCRRLILYRLYRERHQRASIFDFVATYGGGGGGGRFAEPAVYRECVVIGIVVGSMGRTNPVGLFLLGLRWIWRKIERSMAFGLWNS